MSEQTSRKWLTGSPAVARPKPSNTVGTLAKSQNLPNPSNLQMKSTASCLWLCLTLTATAFAGCLIALWHADSAGLALFWDTAEADEALDNEIFRRAIDAETKRLATLRHRGILSYLEHNTNSTNARKIAFLFLVNTGLPLAPLWAHFFAGATPADKDKPLYNIYVHANPAYAGALNQTPALPDCFRGRFIAARRTRRATPSLIAAARRLLAVALADDPLNAHFALVSEHCIPLCGFHHFRHRLASAPSFLEMLDNAPGLVDRYDARGHGVMRGAVPFSKFRAGSQFFVVHRRHAAMFVRDRLHLWDRFRLPCLHSYRFRCYPEEHYFPTMMAMLDPLGTVGYTLTNVNWSGRSDGHPWTYTANMVDLNLIERLRVSPDGRVRFFFARKFAANTLPRLLDISAAILD